MNELKIEDNSKITNILIDKTNNILYKNKNQVLEFINYFYKAFDKQCKIYISNNLINNKEYVIFNFMDISSILYNFKYIKGSLLYDYCDIIIQKQDEEFTILAESDLKMLVDKIVSESKLNLQYDYNFSVNKIISALFDINLNFNIREISNNINIMLNLIMKENANKEYLIFIDSNFINVKLNSDNYCLFDISSRFEAKEYNIFISNEIQNYDYDLILNQIKYMWPKEYSNYEIENILNDYLCLYFNKRTIYTDSENIMIISNIFNKLYDYDQKCIMRNDNNNSIPIELI